MSNSQNPNAPPALSNSAAHQMLEDLNVFHAMTFDGMNGPYKSSRRVAGVRPNVVNSVQVNQHYSTEEFYPANEIDARSIHIGWPALSALPARPSNAIYGDTNPPTKEGNWVSRRLVAARYTVSLRPRDLELSETFIKEVEEALNLPTDEEQLQELSDVCSVWGKWIATDMVIGACMAATGTLAPNQNLTGNSATFRPGDRGPDMMQMIDKCLDITNNFEKRFDSRIQGGYPETFSQKGFDAWLSDALNIDNSSTWEVVKVNRAVPILSLLPSSLQEHIRRIGNKKPPSIYRSIAVGNPGQLNFQGDAQGIKDIKKIQVWQNDATIQDISVQYTDGSVSGPYGYGINNPGIANNFGLNEGELITDVFCWATPTEIVSLQFAKNTGETSTRYGIPRATWNPYLLNGGGDALLGFSGTFTATNITQLQPVWRDDVTEVRYRDNAVSNTGSYKWVDDEVSNDHKYLRDPPTSRISKIEFRGDAWYVSNFQVTYSSNRGGVPLDVKTPAYGRETAGTAESLTLAKDEFIKKVRVRQGDRGVALLEFFTNKGVTKKVGSETEEAHEYILEPPKPDMVLLYFIVGYGVVVRKISLVWGAPPLDK